MGEYTFRVSNVRLDRDATVTAEALDRHWDVMTDVSFENTEQAVKFTDALSIYWRHVQVSKVPGEIWLEHHH